jgi:predicted permease
MRPRGVRRLFSFPFRSARDVRDDVQDEFAFHLDMRSEELRRLGLSTSEARAQAEREFGDRSAGAAACATQGDRLERQRRMSRFIDELRQDVQVALRMLGRSPGFTSVAMLTLALGIGANAAIFSALDAVLLRPLAYPAPDRLVEIKETLENGNPNSVSGGAFLDWRQHNTQFSALVLLGRVTYNLRGRGAPERLNGMEASHDLLKVLGVSPMLGRGFVADDDRPGGSNDVVMLTEELWRTRFGADPSLVGQTIILDEVPRTVIGVLPRGAWLFREDTFVVPAVLRPGTDRAARAPHWAVVFGRLKPESSIERAGAELKAIKTQLRAEYPAFKAGWSVAVRPLPELLAGQTGPALYILVGAVGLVLLIACANVANLLLARNSHRQQEIAVRTALGATGARLIRQVLTESIVLAALGGLAGLAVTWWGVRLLQYLTADILPRAVTPEVDARVLAFALVVTAATGVLFGILPALRARRVDLNDTLKNGGRSATAGGRRRTQSTLIVAEVALTAVLLSSAGLLLRSLANAASVDPGFDPSRVLVFQLSLPKASYDSNERRLAFTAQLTARLRALPGVEQAGVGMAAPFGDGGFGEYFLRDGSRGGEKESQQAVIGRLDFISPGFLEAIGAKYLRGRALADADNRLGAPRVAVINETTARMYFPNADPVGQRIVIAAQSWQILGVVRDMAQRRLDAPQRPYAWVPQVFSSDAGTVAVRTQLSPMSLVAAVQREVQRLDAGVAIANPRSLDEARSASLGARRLVLVLVGAFAGAAVLLACIGLYGVMAYSVATRQREISIRMALGALRRDVVAAVLSDGMRLMLAGLAIGLVGAVAAARLLTSELYHVRSYDPLVLGSAMATLLFVGLVACWAPARRATRVDALAAMRND